MANEKECEKGSVVQRTFAAEFLPFEGELAQECGSHAFDEIFFNSTRCRYQAVDLKVEIRYSCYTHALVELNQLMNCAEELKELQISTKLLKPNTAYELVLNEELYDVPNP